MIHDGQIFVTQSQIIMGKDGGKITEKANALRLPSRSKQTRDTRMETSRFKGNSSSIKRRPIGTDYKLLNSVCFQSIHQTN